MGYNQTCVEIHIANHRIPSQCQLYRLSSYYTASLAAENRNTGLSQRCTEQWPADRPEKVWA